MQEITKGWVHLDKNDGDARRQLSLTRVHMFRTVWRGGREAQESNAYPCLSGRMTDVFPPLTDVRITLPKLAVGGEKKKQGTDMRQLVPTCIKLFYGWDA